MVQPLIDSSTFSSEPIFKILAPFNSARGDLSNDTSLDTVRWGGTLHPFKSVSIDAEFDAASYADRNPWPQKLRSNANNDAKLALPIQLYGTTFQIVAHEHQDTETHTLWHSDASCPKLQLSLYNQPSPTFPSHTNFNIL